MYAMYLRKSRADLDLEALGQGETLARHRTMLYDLASRHDIPKDQIVEFKEVVSGETIAARPEMQRLLNDVYLKKYQGVLVMEVERLARGNTKDQGEVADAFQYSNTLIITPSKVYDPQNEFDQEYFEFGLFMSRREYKTIRRRMEVGRHQSIQEGNYVGSQRPYGYNIQRINKKERLLIINEEEAVIVHMIFDWWTKDRKTSGWIAKELTRMHIPTLTGKSAEWNRGTIVDILKNSHYTGMIRWNRRKSTKEYNAESGQLSRRKRRLSPEDYEEHPGKHQPIISKEQFDLAQSLFTESVPVKLETPLVNPLAGMLICKDCKKALQYQTFTQANTPPRFTHKDSVTCKKKSVYVSSVLDALTDALQGHIDDFTVKISNQGNMHEADKHAEAVLVLKKELEKQQKKKERLFDSWESDDGTYTRDEFIERKKLYQEIIDDLKHQIKALEDSAPVVVDYEEKVITLHKMIDMLMNEQISANDKNLFLKQFIDRIEFDSVDLGRNKGATAVLDVFLK